jgi:superfamily I DNA/RNA helicase
VCYNKFLGEEIARRLNGTADELENLPMLRVGSFHSVANAILGTFAPPIPRGVSEEESQHFWDTAHAAALIENRPFITERYDTIIIDEGQDFKASWVEALEGFLEDPENGRLYVAADEKQTIFGDEWVAPKGFTTMTLTKNIRNTRRISSLVQQLGGAESMDTSPTGPEVTVQRVGGIKETRKAIAKAIDTAVTEMGIPYSQVIVLVPHRADRDELLAEPVGDVNLCRWSNRDEDNIVCETIHSTKGLERSAVIVVNRDEEPDATLTYVGTSRAVAFLAVIGSQALIDMVTAQ